MEQLIKTLPAILRAGGHSAEVVEAAAIAAWKHAAGEPLGNHAVAIKLEEKTLVIGVSDVLWQKQLESIRGQLLFRLNSILGKKLVSRLEFRIDTASVPRTATNRRAPSEPDENEVSIELWSAANAIKDKQLRKAFLDAATTSLRRKADRE
jgi:hypothetical protein